MRGTVRIKFSEAEVARQIRSGADELRDSRYPGLALRVGKSRSTGSWHFIHKRKWQKIGNWPVLKVGAALQAYPEFHKRLAVGAALVVGQSGWVNVGQVLTWYKTRSSTDRSVTKKRRDAIRSAIDLHLLPHLNSIRLDSITHKVIDDELIWPLQGSLELSTIAGIFRVLGSAFRNALELKLIDSNPIAGMLFKQFGKTRSSKPKAGKLHNKDLADLMPGLLAGFEKDPAAGMLALMMLAHGTRVGETRQAQWVDFSLSARVWVLPAQTTKMRVQHTLPLTEQVCALLVRYRALQPPGQIYLFPAKRGQGPLQERRAGELFSTLSEGKWSSHDLRKLARTSWTDLGVDHLIGEMLLSHAIGSLAETYINTTAADLKRDALEAWHEVLDGFLFFHAHGKTGVRRRLLSESAQPTNGAASGDFPPLSTQRRRIGQNPDFGAQNAPRGPQGQQENNPLPPPPEAAFLACARVLSAGSIAHPQKRISWFTVILEIQRAGYSMKVIADAAGIPKSTLNGWKNGSEPRVGDADKLLSCWCQATGKELSEVPRVGIAGW